MDLQQLKSSWKNHVRVCQKCNTEDMRRSKNTPPSNSIAFWSISKKSYNLGNCLVLLIYLKRIRKKSMRKSIFKQVKLLSKVKVCWKHGAELLNPRGVRVCNLQITVRVHLQRKRTCTRQYNQEVTLHLKGHVRYKISLERTLVENNPFLAGKKNISIILDQTTCVLSL